jgi:cell wall-associated NlpC family hydrolase
VLCALAGAVVPLLPQTARADETPTTAAQAATLVARTAQQLSALDEQVQQARMTVAAEQKAAADATARAATAQAAVDAYGPQLRAIAKSGLTGSSSSRVAAFLTSDSADDLVAQITTLDLLAAHTETVIQQVATAADAARAAKATADQAQAKAQADLATLQQQEQQLQDQAAGYKAAYARLSASEQAQVTGPALTASTSAVVAQAPSGAVSTILKAALAELGKPYAFGATGPNAFDCSGLVAYAYAAAGISLPHSSRAQSTMGRQISRANLQPGDIVYFYSPVSHVGIYLGNGKMVEARTFGQPVSVSSVDRGGYRGAVRILG